MLWHKAWLETRWRFISALVILTLLAGGSVFDYLATQRLLPQLTCDRPRHPPRRQRALPAMLQRGHRSCRRIFAASSGFRTFRAQPDATWVCSSRCCSVAAACCRKPRRDRRCSRCRLPVTRKQLLGGPYRNRTRAVLWRSRWCRHSPSRSWRHRSASSSASSMPSRTASASSSSARCSSAWRRFCRRCSATSGGRC